MVKDDTPSVINNVNETLRYENLGAIKILLNGKIIIYRNGAAYDTLGRTLSCIPHP